MPITTSLSGNFGDQIRFYTLLRIIADKNNQPYGLCRTPEYDYLGGKPQIEFFENIDYGEEHNYKYNETPPWITNIWHEKYEIKTFSNGDRIEFLNYQPDVFEQNDSTKFVFRAIQDCDYFRDYKEKIQKWLTMKEEIEFQHIKTLLSHDIFLDEDLCCINVRGGEFRTVPNLILRKDYWDAAIKLMLERNPSMRFMLISDDPQYAFELFDQKYMVVHLDISGDYFILNHAKNLILSNSGFAIFPTWLNKNDPYVIGPRFWSRHSVSTGYWCPSPMWNWGWNYLDKDGRLYKE